MVIKYGTEPNPAVRIRKHQGQMIRKAREIKQMSPTELAELVGVTTSAISQWETGRYAPRQSMQVRIAKALDVPHSLLFNLDMESAA